MVNEIPKAPKIERKRSTNLTQRDSFLRDEQWVERNRAAMAGYDAFVEKEGLLLEDLRTF